jgi:hypothetical protein
MFPIDHGQLAQKFESANIFCDTNSKFVQVSNFRVHSKTLVIQFNLYFQLPLLVHLFRHPIQLRQFVFQRPQSLVLLRLQPLIQPLTFFLLQFSVLPFLPIC